MALITVCVCQLVIAVDMTRLAGSRHVCSRQRERRRAMVKRRGQPCRSAVTCLAIVAEVPCNMVRFRNRLEVGRVALVAIGVYQLVVTVHMARLTVGGHMCSGQWKGGRCMVECCRQPGRGPMARLAVMTEIPRDVVRTVGSGART